MSYRVKARLKSGDRVIQPGEVVSDKEAHSWACFQELLSLGWIERIVEENQEEIAKEGSQEEKSQEERTKNLSKKGRKK